MATVPAPTTTTASSDATLVAGLRLVVMRLARRLRQQAEGDVTPSQVSALSSIERLGPLTLGELAAAEQVQPPSMTKIVGGLEAHGFVIREADPNDRRIARVRVSDDGRRFVARSRTRKNAYLAERLRKFDPDERALLERALPLLERLVDDVR
ncbi:MAG TPA: MarR family transcriptional regulator [Acidimicrobiales bacterium]|nr:MarR family transcriptional regulator [Acidimicrobiales bacterium]